MEIVKWWNWNSLKSPHSVKYFNVLPTLEIRYDSEGFFTFGPSVMDDYCKELSIEFSWLCVSGQITFYWGFYTKSKNEE